MRRFVVSLLENLNLAYHSTLNQKLFDGESLRPEVRHALLKIAANWQKFSNIPDSAIKDVILTGGNANYNYTKFSDCDLHLVIDKSAFKVDRNMIDDYLADKKTLWSLSRNVRIKGYRVELYAQDINDKLVASGVYSLKDDKWLIKPVHGKYDFSKDEALKTKVEELKNTIDTMIEKGYPESEFKVMKDKLKEMRSAALAAGNEFTFDNLVFKSLRNQGILDKMNKYLQNIRDKNLSLD